jgi:hypothetical protein
MKKIYNKRIYITVIGIVDSMDLDSVDLDSDIEVHCTVWLEHDCFILPLLINDYPWFFKSMKAHCNESVKFTGYLSNTAQYDYNVGLIVDTIEYLDQPSTEEGNDHKIL